MNDRYPDDATIDWSRIILNKQFKPGVQFVVSNPDEISKGHGIEVGMLGTILEIPSSSDSLPIGADVEVCGRMVYLCFSEITIVPGGHTP